MGEKKKRGKNGSDKTGGRPRSTLFITEVAQGKKRKRGEKKRYPATPGKKERKEW